MKELVCPDCEVTIYDLVKQCETGECIDKVKRYGITRVPTVVVDSKVAQCCQGAGPNKENLQAAGIGKPL